MNLSHREWNVFYQVICAIYFVAKKLEKVCHVAPCSYFLEIKIKGLNYVEI